MGSSPQNVRQNPLFFSFKVWGFPNPSNGQFSIRYDNPELTCSKLELYDVYGRIVYYSNEEKNQFNLSSYVLGIYLLHVLADDQREFFHKGVLE